MKTRISTVLILCFSLILLGSCDPAKEFEAELKTIDSCQAELNRIDSLYKGIEFDSLLYMVEHILNNERMMKEYYASDTIDMELGVMMNTSKGIRKSMKDVGGAKVKFADEIAAVRTQLDNLETDIRNGVLDKEQVKQYLAAEKDALNTLNLSFMDFYTNQETQSALFYSVVPKVDEYVKKLNVPVEDSIQ